MSAEEAGEERELQIQAKYQAKTKRDMQFNK